MINVYWSPWHHFDVYHERNLSYDDPKWLIEEITKKSNRSNQADNFFKCPAAINQFKNTLVCRNTSDVDVEFVNGGIENRLQSPRINSQVLVSIKPASVLGARTICYSCNWVFFADKPVHITTSSPYAHRTDMNNYGYYVPGTYDISRWFRPVEFAFQMWDGVDEFRSKEGDPLIYVKFNTDEKINLQRFELTKEIYNISKSCMSLKKFSNIKQLNKLYDIFTRNKTNKLLLNEIKRNVL